MGKRDKRGPGLLKLLVMILTGAAIAQELRKPANERTWHGVVGGVVPYDFRVPTPDRIRERLWDPQGSIVQPQVFGVGWTLNLGAFLEMLRNRSAA